MPRRLKKLIGGVGIAATVVMLGIGALLWSARPEPAPSVSVDLLGYTNRTGPHAILAITNRSGAAIRLDPACLVAYTPTRGVAPRTPSAFDANKTAVTRLVPQQGFLQEVFVFPSSRGEWQFECYVAYPSVWLDVRRSLDQRFGKFFGRARLPLRSQGWYRINTEWRDCPP